MSESREQILDELEELVIRANYLSPPFCDGIFKEILIRIKKLKEAGGSNG